MASSVDVGLYYGLPNELVAGHTDVYWAGDKLTRKSAGGFVLMLAGACISWSSKRQSVVAASSVKAEYIAKTRCDREALWMPKLLKDFSISDGPLNLKADNKIAISLAHEWKVNAATKHIAVAYYLKHD